MVHEDRLSPLERPMSRSVLPHPQTRPSEAAAPSSLLPQLTVA